MNLTEAQVQQITSDTMHRVGDIVRAASAVVVAQRIKGLGLAMDQLPEGKVQEATDNEMGVLLGRIVDKTVRCMVSILDEKLAEKPKPRRARKKPDAKNKPRAK